MSGEGEGMGRARTAPAAVPERAATGGPGAPRADYAPSAVPREGAWISAVAPGSPAEEAGLEPGMRVAAVNGVVPRDVIDWRWEADGPTCDLDVEVPGEEGLFECELVREPGEDWGVEFADVLFDGIRTCVNACLFCFMRMLPDDARATLTLRDDDYRLSFLQGNFVTLTNVGDEDLERIVDQRLEPMNVSLHAVSPDVRRRLIGPRAQRGMDVLQALCDEGIEVHGQIVLCAGINDGEELRRTLDWVEARDNITSLALVPMGYTKYSRNFSRSFSEDVEASRAVVRLIEPYQRRSRERLGITRFQLSDEFYIDAQLPVPEAEHYDGYPQYYDGIGMLRSFLDEARDVCEARAGELARVREALEGEGGQALLVCGEAAQATIDVFCRAWAPGTVRTQAIRNDYYGGDVNVTGLIVACDLLAQLPEDLARTVVVLPAVMFNFEGATLDGDTRDHVVEVLRGRGGTPVVCEPSPHAIADVLADVLLG